MSAVRLDIERSCLGRFVVNSGALLVGDSCCHPFTTQARKGAWFAFRERAPVGIWGRRNTRLQVVHADFLGYELDVVCEKPESHVIGVDAGQVVVIDAAVGFDDDAALDAPRDAIVAPGHGVLVSSGIGDGAYDATVFVRDAVAVAIDIEFIGETAVRLAQCTLPGVEDLPGELRPELQRVQRTAITAYGPPIPVWFARPVEDLQWLLPIGVDIEEHRQTLWECVELDDLAYGSLQQRCFGRLPALVTDGVKIYILGEYEGHRGLWTTHSLVRDGTMVRSLP